MIRSANWIPALAILVFSAGTAKSAPPPIDGLSDEFNSAATLTDWTRVMTAESWPADQLETYDINVTNPGFMTMMPYTVTWYQDYRGPLTFKLVDGDFVATSRVIASNRANTGAPGRSFSLGGIMARTPRAITSGTWTAGGENYVFLSIGCGGSAGAFQFEVKTTTNSVSTLIYTDTNDGGEALIQTARIGQYFIQLRKTVNGSWTVHQRYTRGDMPSTLQVGLVSYTDWDTVSTWPVVDHNNSQILTQFMSATPSVPDLIGRFDYLRFQRPVVPAPLVGLDFSNPLVVSDAQLLSFLGDNANAPPSSVKGWEIID